MTRKRRPRIRARGLIAVVLIVASAPVFAVAFGSDAAAGAREAKQERYLYVATIAQSATDPDFVTVIGADPRKPDFGTIVDRIDMPNVGDELHHFGYSHDQRRLIVPGLFSNRIHILGIEGDGRTMSVDAVNDELAARSGYVVPHTVIATSPRGALVTMIGAATGDTKPGGIVEIDTRTGAFTSHFGPGPTRDANDLGPEYMYDFDALQDADLGISSTFGPPALCAGGIDPTCLGDEVAVWDTARQRVTQVANLGANNGALEVRFIHERGVRRALMNMPGTSTVWLADDDDHDGVFDFQQVLGPEDGILIPTDMLLSYDSRSMYVANWFADTVQQFDISDPFEPVLTSTVSVPHPNMLRLSRDNSRLYVTNSLLSTWDNDTRFGPARNDEYGLWLFDVDERTGKLTSRTPDGSSWVSFENVRKKSTTGPAGPHMMLFDPSVRLEPGEH